MPGDGAGSASSPVVRWAELVFHVLAHVPDSAHLAPSVWDERWVAFVAGCSGPADRRHLGEDVNALGLFTRDHRSLVRLQRLAWLFDDAAKVAACSERPLAELGAGDVDRPELLPLLTASDLVAWVESLRAAAELEAEVYASLPPARTDHEALEKALGRLSAVAPFLPRCEVVPIRPLRLRGRIWGNLLWIGLPCADLGPSVEHVAWQASHEATVGELATAAASIESGPAVRHDPLEHAALVLLAIRARRAGLAGEHQAWIGHLASHPPLRVESLPQAWRSLVETLLEAPAAGVAARGERSDT